MAEYTGYIESKSGNEHEILIDFYYHFECDDNNLSWPELDSINGIWIVTHNSSFNSNDVPKGKDITILETIDLKTNKPLYKWSHYHELKEDSWVVNKILDEAFEKYDFAGEGI